MEFFTIIRNQCSYRLKRHVEVKSINCFCMESKGLKITFEGLFCAQMKDFYGRLKNEKAYLPSYRHIIKSPF